FADDLEHRPAVFAGYITVPAAGGVVAEIGGSAHEVGFLFFTKSEGTLDRWSFGALVVTNEKSNELSF
ncbi:MAG: hypothetical protein ACJAX1_002841, partial [Neolewinella sp.]